MISFPGTGEKERCILAEGMMSSDDLAGASRSCGATGKSAGGGVSQLEDSDHMACMPSKRVSSMQSGTTLDNHLKKSMIMYLNIKINFSR
jgi:hypothetical protein